MRRPDLQPFDEWAADGKRLFWQGVVLCPMSLVFGALMLSMWESPWYGSIFIFGAGVVAGINSMLWRRLRSYGVSVL